MQEFLTALSAFTPSQLFISLAILAPVVGAVWAAMKWAYETRLQNLEVALNEHRADFDRRLGREKDLLNEAHKKEVDALTAKLVASTKETDQAKGELAGRLVSLESRGKDLHNQEVAFVQLFTEEFPKTQPLTDRAISFLANHRHMLTDLSFSPTWVEGLREKISAGDTNAGFLLGYMLIVSNRVPQPNPAEGEELLRWAAERGHSEAQAIAILPSAAQQQVPPDVLASAASPLRQDRG